MSKLKIETMLNASASYKDLIGEAQLAWDIDEHTALMKVASMSKIDTATYEPIGLSIMLTEDGFYLSVFLARRIPSESGKKKVKRVLTEINHKQFFKLVKDLDITLFKPFEKHNELYEYEGEESLSEVIRL